MVKSKHQLNNQTHTNVDDELLLYSLFTRQPSVVDEHGLLLYSQKIPAAGEDAIPILRPKKPTGLVAVCDGLGGAGSIKYDVKGTVRTGASIAADAVRYCLEAYYEDRHQAQPNFSVTSTDVSNLQQFITKHLQDILHTIQHHKPRLRSNMIKPLPTTMASLFYTVSKTECKCTVLWAGDSRVYCLGINGLQQLTADDVASSVVATMAQDEPMNNYIHAGGDYRINYRVCTMQLPCLLFAATDGVFGYVPSPMHFEKLLFDTMQKSPSWDQWGDMLDVSLKSVAGDDFSLSLVWLGQSNLRDMYAALKKRHQYINELLAKHALSQAWEEYRNTYEYR